MANLFFSLTNITLSLGSCRHLKWSKIMLFEKLRQDVIELAECCCRAKTKVSLIKFTSAYLCFETTKTRTQNIFFLYLC